MSLDKSTVAAIAKLAHIALSDEETALLSQELSGILTWIEQLGEVPTENVPQLASVSETALPWRADDVTDGGRRDDILANAPASEHGCFVVPKVLE